MKDLSFWIVWLALVGFWIWSDHEQDGRVLEQARALGRLEAMHNPAVATFASKWRVTHGKPSTEELSQLLVTEGQLQADPKLAEAATRALVTSAAAAATKDSKTEVQIPFGALLFAGLLVMVGGAYWIWGRP